MDTCVCNVWVCYIHIMILSRDMFLAVVAAAVVDVENVDPATNRLNFICTCDVSLREI